MKRFTSLLLAGALLAPSAAFAQPPAIQPPAADLTAAPVPPPGPPCAPTTLSPPMAARRPATLVPGTAAAPPGVSSLAVATPGAPGTAPTPRPAPPPATPATQPRPRDDARHKAFVACAQTGAIDLLFVGDSITDWWQQAARGLPVYEANYGTLKVANFGIAGDTTQGVLWRMQNGELEGFKAKTIVFMLGTNNINRNGNADIAAGDAAIIAEFRKRQPQAKVLVLGVFPRGAAPDNPYRASIREINGHLAALADNRNVFYLDIGPAFLTPDGTLTTEIMADGLHPTAKGYEVWAQAMAPKLAELMR